MNVKRADKLKVVDKLMSLFKDDQKQPMQFSDTQKKIIYEIALKEHNRVGVIACTQEGKSTATACGIIIRAITCHEGFCIIGGTKTKAAIIQGYVIEHLFDDEFFKSRLNIEGGALEKLHRERKQDHITFKGGGSVRCISADYKNTKKAGDRLLGEGEQNIVIDDSVLCDDALYAYIKRMVGGHKVNFIIELANPLKRNHFYRTMTDKKNEYFKIWTDYTDAMKAGRFTKEFIDEMRKEKFFDVFYECKFPASDSIDEKGYMQLLSDSQVDDAVSPIDINLNSKAIKLGVDVAVGGNNTVFVMRDNKKARVDKSIKTPNLMEIPGIVINYMRETGIINSNVFIDGTGVGSGVSARLKEQQFNINNLVWGSAASQKSKDESKDKGLPGFSNMRAECYWNLREWILHGGKIAPNDNLITQLKGIRYRVNSSGSIQVQPKDEMQILGCDSPDEADALAMTFAESENVAIDYALAENNSAFSELGISARDLEAFSMKNY